MKRKHYHLSNLSVEEILVDKHAKTFEENFERLERPISKNRVFRFFVFSLLCILVILSRVFYLNIIKGQENYIISEKNRTRYILIKAPRGIIYDRYHNAIVSNKTSLSLILLPRDFFDTNLPSKDLIVNQISSIFNLDIKEIEAIIKKIDEFSYEPILIKTNITSDMARLFESDIKKENRLGFYIIEDYTRAYGDEYAFTHVVGYTGRMSEEDVKNYPQYPIADLIGKYGIESKYEKYLHGLSGKQMMEVDARSKINPELGIIDPEPGNRLITTIDKDLQEFVYKSLQKTADKLGLKKGTAIMANPKTGEILAMVSIPSINADAFSSGSPKNIIQETLTSKFNPFINRAISGLYSPGSTIKPLVALAALMEKTINPEDNIKDVDAIVIPNKYNPDKPSIFKDWKNHGLVNMRTAIAYSCNIYFYALGGGYKDIPGLGITRLKKYWELFHLGSKLGIDLENEKDGNLPDPEYKKRVNPDNPLWLLGDTYNVSIGQGDLLLTPLQIAYYIGSIANHGKIMKPYVVSEILDDDNKVIFKQTPIVIKNVNIPQDYLDIVLDGMRKVVTLGSGQLMKTIPFEVAGKTGSAQIQGNTKTNAIFAGFAPYKDPEVLILVLLEEPPEGSVVTIPLVDEILRYYYNNRYINKPEVQDFNNETETTTTTTTTTTVVKIQDPMSPASLHDQPAVGVGAGNNQEETTTTTTAH